MRTFVRRYGLAASLIIVGLALLAVGTGAALSAKADAAKHAPAQATRATAEGSGLGLDADLAVTGLGDAVALPTIHADPPAAKKLPLPSLTVERDVSVERAGVGLALDLGLQSGSHRATQTETQGVAVAAQGARVLTPMTVTALAAAAAFTLAGVVAAFWTPIKTLGFRLLVLPLIPLYAKVSRAEVFENHVRERIFQAIKANPGLAASDLARLGGVSWGTTIYHLEVLEQTRMVTSLRKGRYRRYFENGAVLDGSKDQVAILRNEVTAGVVQALRATPGATQKELAAATSMTPQALHWHLARLVSTGLVRKEREGRVVRHFTS